MDHAIYSKMFLRNSMNADFINKCLFNLSVLGRWSLSFVYIYVKLHKEDVMLKTINLDISFS